MVAKKKGPIEGRYIPVKLPWKGATSNEPQFVSMKEPIALLLGFKMAKDKDLEFEIKIKTKDGSKTVTRRRRPGNRTPAVKCEFGRDDNGNLIKQKIGGKNVLSFQFPITNSVSIHEIIKSFETDSDLKKLKVKRVVNQNTGQGYPVR